MSFRRRGQPKAPDTPVQTIVIGLGNPGPEYRDTRHNLGFMVVDEVARRSGVRLSRHEAGALIAQAPHPGSPETASVLLAEPQTFMNLSGRSAAGLARKHNLGPDSVWLVYDEMDLDFGRVRMRLSGSAGGHNGVRSVVQELGSTDVPRVRLGVGHPEEGDAVDHLLDAFSRDERERVPALIQLGADAVIEALQEGFEIAMNRFNGRTA